MHLPINKRILCSQPLPISFLIGVVFVVFGLSVQATSQQGHVLYNLKNPKIIKEGICGKSSPEIFFHHVAQPSLSLLYFRSKAFFGILMDQIEASSLDSQNDKRNETKEQWEFITKTVSESLDSAVDRAETSWDYFIITHETQPLPWEKQHKLALLLDDALYQLEYSYTMVDAVIRSGTKEIVGTLQIQLTNVIRKLELEVSKISKKGEDVTEQILFKQMKQALAGIKPSFTTKLLEKVISRALDRYSPKNASSSAHKTTFISETLDQMAILLHAVREKGMLYPNFWNEMTQIFTKEYNIKDNTDENDIIVNLMRDLSNQDTLIDLIVQIISRENKTTG